MPSHPSGLSALADRIALRRDEITARWRAAVEADASLTTGASLPRSQMLDHIPALLDGFERQLRDPDADTAQLGDAAAHGLHRWQQGFGLAEVSRELGHLNECVVKEIDRHAGPDPAFSLEDLATARSLWAGIYSITASASTAQYFKLQQMEAACYVDELQTALHNLHELERHRAVLWQQAAHDLRGNLGVVSNATAGLGFPNLDGTARESFLRMIARNVLALHKLLDDITCLARLQSGQEPRRLGPVDVAALLTEMGENLSLPASSAGLSFQLAGPPSFQVRSDAVKLHRIVQNLVLNAIRYTQAGGVTVSWGEAGPRDPERWFLEVQDSGPGLGADAVSDLQDALETATKVANGESPAAHGLSDDNAMAPTGGEAASGHGEGIGLSIVKRLCELLDATIQVESDCSGTRFRILLPKQYPPDPPAADT